MENIKDLLDQLEFSQVDSTQLIEKIIFANPEYVEILQESLKTEFLIPISDKIKNFYKKIENKIDSNSNDSEYIKNSADPLGLSKLGSHKIEIEKSFIAIKNDLLQKIKSFELEANKLITPENFIDDISKNVNINLPKNEENQELPPIPEIDFSSIETISKDILESVNSNFSEIFSAEEFSEFSSHLEELKNMFLDYSDYHTLNSKELNDFVKEISNQLKIIEEDLEGMSDIKTLDIKMPDTKPIENSTIPKFDTLETISDSIKAILQESLENLDYTLQYNLKTLSSELQEIFNSNIKSTLEKEEVPLEQKSLLETNEIDININQDSRRFIAEILNKHTDAFNKNFKSSIEDRKSIPEKKEEKSTWEYITDLFIGGAAFLALGGIAGFVTLGWDKYIKPYLEENFGGTFKTFDQLMQNFAQTWDNIAKWFTLGGLSIAGNLFKSLSGFLTDGVEAIFKAILGKPSAGFFGHIVKGLGGDFLTKIAGQIAGKMGGILALKRIPIIGGLISFGVAYDDFNKGDYIGGAMNLVSGVLSFIGPVGYMLSFGVDILNAILEYQSGGEEGSNEQQMNKADILSGWLTNVGNIIKKFPLFEWIYGIGEGIAALIDGDFGTALDHFEKIPILGTVTGLLRAFYESSGVVAEDGTYTFFDMKKFGKQFQTRMLKNLIGWIPNIFRKTVIGWLGLNAYADESDLNGFDIIDYFSEKPEDIKVNIPEVSENMKKGIKMLKTQEEFDNFENNTNSKLKEYSDKIMELNSKLSEGKITKNEESQLSNYREEVEKLLKQKQLLEEQKEKINVKDASIPSNVNINNRTISIENKTIIPDSSDNILVYQGQTIEKTFAELKSIMTDMTIAIHQLQANKTEEIINNYNISNSSKTIQPSNAHSMLGSRDSIFDARMDYWKILNTERIAI